MLTLRVPAASVEEISDRIWTQPGILGVQESPLGGAMFAVREDFEILEFGSEAARKCADWLEAESFRQGAELLLKVYLDPPESFDPKTFLKEVDEEGKSKVEGFVLLEEEDYLANYKKSVPGTSFGKNFWIGPPWADQPADRKCFVVEPGLGQKRCRLGQILGQQCLAVVQVLLILGVGNKGLVVVQRRFQLEPGMLQRALLFGQVARVFYQQVIQHLGAQGHKGIFGFRQFDQAGDHIGAGFLQLVMDGVHLKQAHQPNGQ